MEKNSILSFLFTKTINSIKRQINLSYRIHTTACWMYYLAHDYKLQGCDSEQLTQRKLICKKRSKSHENISSETVKEKLKRCKSLEPKSKKHSFYVELKYINDIVYKCECDY